MVPPARTPPHRSPSSCGDAYGPGILSPLLCLTPTLRISQLQESGFWRKCLSMKPSFAKQIRVFSRTVLTCSITFENVLLCRMSPVWLL